MLHANTSLVVALTVLSASGGGIARTPLQPESPPSNRPNTLSIFAFSVSGWYDGQFHYFPRLSVSPGRTEAPLTSWRCRYAVRCGSEVRLRATRFGATTFAWLANRSSRVYWQA
jgi:hypothetical protein